jgi:Ca2+-binding EF-hand superfamily protein
MGACTTTNPHQVTTSVVHPLSVKPDRSAETMTEEELKELLEETFRKFDKDNDDFLNYEEVQELVKQSFFEVQGKRPSMTLKEATGQFMRFVDTNQDGKIDRKEFYTFYKSR